MNYFAPVSRVRGSVRIPKWLPKPRTAAPPSKPRPVASAEAKKKIAIKNRLLELDTKYSRVLHRKYFQSIKKTFEPSRWREAIADYDAVVAKGGAGIRCLITIISILLKQHKPYQALKYSEKLLEEHKEKAYSSLDTASVLIGVYSGQKDLFRCKLVFAKFLGTSPSKPDSTLYGSIIAACVRNNDVSAAREIFAQAIVDERFADGKPNGLWNVGIKTCASIEEAKILVRKMQTVDPYTLTELLSLCKKYRDLKSAEEFLNDPMFKSEVREHHNNSFLSVVESVDFDDLHQRYLQLERENKLSYYPCLIVLRGVLNVIIESPDCYEKLRETHLPIAESAFFFMIDNKVKKFTLLPLWTAMFRIYHGLKLRGKLRRLAELAIDHKIPLSSPLIAPYLPDASRVR